MLTLVCAGYLLWAETISGLVWIVKSDPRPFHGTVERHDGREIVFDNDAWPIDREVIEVADLSVLRSHDEWTLAMAFRSINRIKISAIDLETGEKIRPDRVDGWLPEIRREWGLLIGARISSDLDDRGQATYLDNEYPDRIHWFGVAWNLAALLCAGMLPVSAAWFGREVVRRRREHWRTKALARAKCPKCGYDIRRLPNARCPECGETWEDEAEKTARA